MPFPSLRRAVTRRLGIDALRADHATQAAALAAHQAALDQHAADRVALNQQIERAHEQIAALRDEHRAAALAQTVIWATLWNAGDPTQLSTTVSVVLPTRNRADLLPRAVQSVLRQANVQVELIVVDDGSTDHTAAVLAGIDDPRLVVLQGGGTGAAAARNLAIGRATGEVIAFADDDNIMAPGWLAAAAGHLRTHESTAAVYGAQIREPEDDGDITLLYRVPFSRDDMLLGPFIDLGATAFRAGTGELHFDESLTALIDWDMLIRVTAQSRLDAIPVLASLYTTSAPNRISTRPDKADALQTVQARAAAERAAR